MSDRCESCAPSGSNSSPVLGRIIGWLLAAGARFRHVCAGSGRLRSGPDPWNSPVRPESSRPRDLDGSEPQSSVEAPRTGGLLRLELSDRLHGSSFLTSLRIVKRSAWFGACFSLGTLRRRRYHETAVNFIIQAAEQFGVVCEKD